MRYAVKEESGNFSIYKGDRFGIKDSGLLHIEDGDSFVVAYSPTRWISVEPLPEADDE